MNRKSAGALLAGVLVFVAMVAVGAMYSPSGSDASPSITSCGSSPSVAGTDNMGVITAGTGLLTACTLNFSATLPYTPVCVVSTNAVTSIIGVTTISTSAMTIGLSVSLPGGKIYYHCVI
jgi:hypothetical protein